MGLCELYRATGEVRFLTPAINAGNDIVENQLLITGGASSHGEAGATTTQYAYGFKDEAAETCVTVYWIELTTQLLRIRGEARYADELEKTLYNQLAAANDRTAPPGPYTRRSKIKKSYSSALTGCSAAGPLAWAMVPEFAYMSSEDGVVVNFLTPGAAFLKVRGETITVKQESRLSARWPRHDYRHGSETDEICASRSNAGLVADQRRQIKAGAILAVASNLEQDPDDHPRFFDSGRVLKGSGAADGKIAIARGPHILALDKVYNPELEPLAALHAGRRRPAADNECDLSRSGWHYHL